jgi:Zn-dependent protease
MQHKVTRIMGWRLKIGRAIGTDVFLHWTFFFAPLYVVLLHWQSGSGWPILGILIVWLLAVFSCVLLHEYGHVLAARHFGVQARDIIITPIGGLARLVNMPKDPVREFAIAIAGPAVNLAVAMAFAFYLAVTHQYFLPSEGLAGLFQFPQLMMWLNLFLFLFNLIPAFPMDGGRILRSLLAVSLNHETATRVAGLLGQFLAVGTIAYGIYSREYQLSLLGTFVFLTAAAEIAIRKHQAA